MRDCPRHHKHNFPSATEEMHLRDAPKGVIDERRCGRKTWCAGQRAIAGVVVRIASAVERDRSSFMQNIQ